MRASPRLRSCGLQEGIGYIMFVHELIYQGKPDSLAIVDHERRITYRELQEHVAACRNRLYAAGVRVGDRVNIEFDILGKYLARLAQLNS